MPCVDNEAALTWLDDAFNQALTQGRYDHLAYLEAVLEELIFESELYATSRGLTSTPPPITGYFMPERGPRGPHPRPRP